jgi:RNA polymerase sigma-70 factor (ECF subfamily)
METSASLLERLRTAPDETAWRRLDDLYRPLLRRWLLRDPSLCDEAEDIVQDVMAVLVRELPNFQRRRTGSFRRWLRTIMAHRLAAYCRSRKNRPRPLAGPQEECLLVQLAEPHSQLSRQWDDEHDRYVLRRLMDLIAPQFEPTTLAAFRRVAFEGVAPARVAEELGLTLNTVLIAKSRALSKLRQETEGLVGRARIFLKGLWAPRTS